MPLPLLPSITDIDDKPSITQRRRAAKDRIGNMEMGNVTEATSKLAVRYLKSNSLS